MLKIASFLALLLIVSTNLNNNIFDSKIYVNKQIPISRLEAAGHRFAISSTDTYEINGEVYESESIFQEKQIYNLANYKKSKSCTYFKSVIEMNSIQGQYLDFVALTSLISEQTKQLLIVGIADQVKSSKKFINIYSYNDSNFVFQDKLNFHGTSLSQDIDVDILMTKFGNTILFADGNFLYILQKNLNQTQKSPKYLWKKVQGWNSAKNAQKGEQLLGFQKTTFQDRELLLFLYTQKIVFYEYDETKNSAQIYLEILNDGNEAFEDVEIGSNNTQIYALAGNQLLFYSLPDYKTPVKNELAGQLCNRIYIYTSTFHIICQYEKRNFIGEYFYNDTMNALILNRFYNDIQNYRLISYIKNYFLMVGENDIILTSNGVNRKVLLDMPKNPYSEKFVSFGIQSLHLLNMKKDNNQNDVLFAVGEDFLVLFELKMTPAEVWCNVERAPESLQKSIIIVRNTSQCVLNEEKQTLKSICINLKPVQLYFQQFEIEQKLTSIFMVVVVLLAFVLAFLCLGCVFRQNMNYNRVIVDIKKKIKTLQKKQTKEI